METGAPHDLNFAEDYRKERWDLEEQIMRDQNIILHEVYSTEYCIELRFNDWITPRPIASDTTRIIWSHDLFYWLLTKKPQ